MFERAASYMRRCRRVLLLGAFARGEFARHAYPLGDLPVGVEHRHGARERPGDRAVGEEHAALQLELPLREGVADDLAGFAPGRRDGCTPPSSCGLEQDGGAMNSRPSSSQQFVEVGAHPVNDVRTRRDQRAKTLFASRESLFRDHP